MTLVGFVLRALAARQRQNIGALAGIAVAVASFVALVGLARGVEDALLSALEARGTDVVITEAGALDLVSSLVPDSLADEITGMPGVAAAAPELSRLTTLEDGRSLAVAAWRPGTFPWENLDIVEGRMPGPEESGVAVLGDGLASRLDIGPGMDLWLFQAPFKVVGVAKVSNVLGRNVAYVRLADAQALTFREGQATTINVRLEPTRQEQTLAALRARYPRLSVEKVETLSGNYLFGRIARVLAVTISTVALLSAVLVIFNTMSLAVVARRGEIAILSAIGWARWRIVTGLLIEGAMISLAAGLVGIGVGIAVAEIVAARPGIAGFVAPALGPGLLVQALLLSVAVGLVGSLVPALRAVARPPSIVLRGH